MTLFPVELDKKKRRRDEDYKIADVMSKEVSSHVTDRTADLSFTHLLTLVLLDFVSQEIMSQAKKAKVEEAVRVHFILTLFHVGRWRCLDTRLGYRSILVWVQVQVLGVQYWGGGFSRFLHVTQCMS